MLLKTKSYEVLFGTGFASKGFAGFANPMLPPIASYSQTNADRKTKTSIYYCRSKDKNFDLLMQLERQKLRSTNAV